MKALKFALVRLVFTITAILISVTLDPGAAWPQSPNNNSIDIAWGGPTHPKDTTEIVTGGCPVYQQKNPANREVYVAVREPDCLAPTANLVVINSANHSIKDEIPLPTGFPMQIVFSPDGALAYVAMSKAAGQLVSKGSNRILVIDTETRQIIRSFPIYGHDFGTQGMTISPDGNTLYASQRGSGWIDFINTTTGKIKKSLPVGPIYTKVPVGIAVTHDNSRLYVANRVDATVTVIRIADYQILKTIPLGLKKNNNHGTDVEINADDTEAYVSLAMNGKMAVIDIDPASPTYHQVKYIDTGAANLGWITLSEEENVAYVAGLTANVLFVVDIDPLSPTRHQVIDVYDTELSPLDPVVVDGFHGKANGNKHAYPTHGDTVYVTNTADGTISVIRPELE